MPLLPPNDTSVALAFYSQNHGATNIDSQLDPTGQRKANLVSVQAALRDVVNDRGPKMKGKEGKEMRERGAQVPSEGRKSYVGHDGRGSAGKS